MVPFNRYIHLSLLENKNLQVQYHQMPPLMLLSHKQAPNASPPLLTSLQIFLFTYLKRHHMSHEYHQPFICPSLWLTSMQTFSLTQLNHHYISNEHYSRCFCPTLLFTLMQIFSPIHPQLSSHVSRT